MTAPSTQSPRCSLLAPLLERLAKRRAKNCLYFAIALLTRTTLSAPQPSEQGYGSDHPLSQPAIFGDGIISTGDSESHPAFTPDGRTVYFLKNSPTFNFWTICLSHFRQGKWSAPEIAPFSGQYSDADPFITSDGDKFFFISNRPAAPKSAIKEDTDMWVMTREGSSWSDPVNLGAIINSKGNEWYPTVAADGTLYFGSDRAGGFGQTDIYRAKLVDGQYTAPVNLGPPISTSADEYEPFIAPDQSYLLFMAHRSDGKGRGDLYLSYKHDGKWSDPVTLCDKINSSASEFSPKISPDGKYFFWSSARTTIKPAQEKALTFEQLATMLRSPGNGLLDIYYIDIGELHLH